MKAQVSGGRMLDHGRAVGTSTPADVERRAREIAETNGRPPGQYNQADLDQARQEILGFVSSSADHDDEKLAQVAEWTEVPSSSGHQAPTKSASDEQTAAERLVEEGVEDAAHEQMLEGNRASRAADQT
jgi:hypothetical protein